MIDLIPHARRSVAAHFYNRQDPAGAGRRIAYSLAVSEKKCAVPRSDDSGTSA